MLILARRGGWLKIVEFTHSRCTALTFKAFFLYLESAEIAYRDQQEARGESSRPKKPIRFKEKRPVYRFVSRSHSSSRSLCWHVKVEGE